MIAEAGMKTMQKALLSLISGLFLISPALSQEYKQVSLVDLGVNTRRFAGKPIEIRNVWCYFSDVDDYRCAGSGATAVFFKKIENEGLTISVGAPAELEQYVQAEQARWRKIILENKIQTQ
jgi:hypothetical protein